MVAKAPVTLIWKVSSNSAGSLQTGGASQACGPWISENPHVARRKDVPGGDTLCQHKHAVWLIRADKLLRPDPGVSPHITSAEVA